MLKHQRIAKSCLEIQKSLEEPKDIDILNPNDLKIVKRNDGYVNLTLLCQSGNEQYKRWIRMTRVTKNFLPNLSIKLKKPKSELIKQGGTQTWGHADIVPDIVKWMTDLRRKRISRAPQQVNTEGESKEEESDDSEEESKEEEEVFESVGAPSIIPNSETPSVVDESHSGESNNIDHELQKPQLIQDTTFKLKLLNNEILDIAIRKDGYINATQLCKAGNKLFGHYQTSKQTQDYLQALSSNIGIPIMKLLDSKVGGSHSGTYVHRKVAYHLAQWISPQFAVQVSNVLDELILTGKVELGKEKSTDELENVYKEKLSHMENQLESTKNELKVLSKTHNSMLRRQKRTPYEIGNVVYIVSHEAFTGFYKTDYFKVGEATQTSGEQYGAFVNRLSGYNTSAPINFKVNFLIYIEENKLVENSTLVRFRKNLNPSNKEWIKSVDFKTITEYIVSLCELMNIEYKIVVNDPIVQNMEICGEVEEEEEEEEEEIKEEERKKLNGKYECVTCHECNISDKRAMNCVACAQKLSRKVKQRPTREQLLEDTRTMSVVDIGKKYGVSDNCIRKWIKNS